MTLMNHFISVFHSPCPGTMASNLLSITKCSAQNPYSCPSGHWCHIGGTPETTVCCPGGELVHVNCHSKDKKWDLARHAVGVRERREEVRQEERESGRGKCSWRRAAYLLL